MAALAAMAVALAAGCASGASDDKELAYRAKGISAMEAADFDNAAKNFQKALDQHVGGITDLELDICYYKALSQFKAGDIGDSIETYTSIIDYDEKNTDAYYLRGNVYLKAGKTEQAISDFDKALNLTEDYGKMATEMASALIDAGEAEKAKAYLNKVLSQESGEDAAYYQGVAYYLMEDYENAVKKLSACISGGNSDGYVMLAQSYVAQGQSANAASAIESYLSKNEADAGALNISGCIYLQNEKYDKAIKEFDKALELNDDNYNKEIQKNRISAYEHKGDYDTAFELIKQYIGLYPDDADAVREKKFIKTRK